MQTNVERGRALRRRNIFTGIALVLLTPTMVVHATEDGMQWALWRDAPLVGVVFVAAALCCGIIAWRSRP